MGRTIETIRPPHQRGAAFRPLLGLTVSMSLRLVIPWRVALQQRPPPLHQPVKILKQEWQFEKSNYSMASVTIENCLNRGVHPNSLSLCVSFVPLCETLLETHLISIPTAGDHADAFARFGFVSAGKQSRESRGAAGFGRDAQGHPQSFLRRENFVI